MGSGLASEIAADSPAGAATTASVGSDGSGLDVTVIAAEGSTDAAAAVVLAYGTVDAQADGRVTGTVQRSALTDISNASAVRFVQRPNRRHLLDTGGEDEVNVTTVQQLPSGNFTGNGSTIAVIDLEAFNQNDPVYSDQVIERRGTSSEANVDGAHGTETAEAVA